MPGRQRRGGKNGSFAPFRSRFEASIASTMEKQYIPYKYESVRIPYQITKQYIPDFVLSGPRGTIYVETKGYFTSSDRSKLLQLKKQTDADIRLVFQRSSNTLNKNSTTTYAQWADKHDFVWAEGYVPAAWYKEIT